MTDPRETAAREVLAAFSDRDGHHQTAATLRGANALCSEDGGRTCIDAMLAFADHERERAAKVAERDADWTGFAKSDLEPWEDGPDNYRDYRLGIRVGAVIAAAIRAGGGMGEVG